MGRAGIISLPIFLFSFSLTGFPYVAQAGLKLLILLPYPLSSEIIEKALLLVLHFFDIYLSIYSLFIMRVYMGGYGNVMGLM